jgi:hypothetical protein
MGFELVVRGFFLPPRVGAKRSDGKLPPHVVAYLTMALCLFAEDDYTEVATQARKRLGRTVFPEIFERTCGPVAGDGSAGSGLLALGRARGS